MKPLRKALIPAGGVGTRLLPATNAIPKELLPIVDKPLIQFIVEELAESGFDELVLVTGRQKGSIEDHFGSMPELKGFLEAKGRVVCVGLRHPEAREELLSFIQMLDLASDLA